MVSPNFFNKSEFGNKLFIIWATISSRSCFCWLYRASPFLAAENIINLISVSTIWWCPCVESSLVLLEEGVCYDQCILLAEAFALLHSVLQGQICLLGVSWLPTFAFQPSIMKRTSFWGIGYRRSCRTVQLQLLQWYWSGYRLGLLWFWMVCLGNEQREWCCRRIKKNKTQK